MRSQRASTVRSAACLSRALSLANRFSIGRIGRQVAQIGVGGLDRLAHADDLVRGQVVHDHAVAWIQGRRQELLDIGQEDLAVDRAVEHQRRDHAVAPQAGQEGGGLPVAMRDGAEQPFTPPAAPVAPRHVGGGPGFIEEDQLGRIEPRLSPAPLRARRGYIGAFLLGGVRGFF